MLCEVAVFASAFPLAGKDNETVGGLEKWLELVG